MRFLVVLSLCFALALAGPKPRNHRVVGGESTTIDKWPFMASMIYNWWGIFNYQACGGSLITTQTILSATHCYVGDRPADWSVRVGTSYPESGGSLHTVAQITNHPQYNNLDYDVSIIRLSNAVTLGTNVAVAQVAGANYRLPAGTEVWTIGWGTLWSNGPAANVLQEVALDIIDYDICAYRYWELKQNPQFANWPDITPRMICAGILDVGGKDACQGDSGGPLIHNGNVVVGIVSWGRDCADEYYPGVNADVAEMVDWIVANGST